MKRLRKRKPDKDHPESADSSGSGDVSLALFESDSNRETEKDLRLLRMAVAKGWPIPKEKMGLIVERMTGIVQKESVTVATPEGPVEDESITDKNASSEPVNVVS